MIYIGVLIVVVNAPPEQPIKQPPIVQEPPPMPRDPGLIYRTCDRCTWINGYESETSAKQGSASHRRWCRNGHGRKKQLFG